jgi:hypothetical protein
MCGEEEVLSASTDARFFPGFDLASCQIEKLLRKFGVSTQEIVVAGAGLHTSSRSRALAFRFQRQGQSLPAGLCLCFIRVAPYACEDAG